MYRRSCNSEEKPNEAITSKPAKSGKKKTIIIAEESIIKNVIGTKLSDDDPDHFYVVDATQLGRHC